MKKALTTITCLALAVLMLASCSKSDTQNGPITTTTSKSTTSTTQQDMNDEKQDEQTTAKPIIKDEESKSIIETMYSDYDVRLDKTVDNVQYYTILKDSKEYARLKVDLLTGDCYETVAETDELTTFNLLS